jgi:opacity protein-like surface antigen
MKRLFACTLLTLGGAAAALAQAPSATNQPTQATAPIDFANTSAARITFLEPVNYVEPSFLPADPAAVPSIGSASTATVSTADPEPANPSPKFVFGGRDDYRFQIGLGVVWDRFRSSIFDASAVGVNTSFGYFTNDWFAIEGNVNASFAPTIFVNEHVKLLIYGAGPKIAWRQRRWEPWLHGLVGGIHEQPETAGNSKNAFAVQLGGGADYRWNPRLAVRLEADYVRSSLFGGHQDNFQLIAGFVFHF